MEDIVELCPYSFSTIVPFIHKGVQKTVTVKIIKGQNLPVIARLFKIGDTEYVITCHSDLSFSVNGELVPVVITPNELVQQMTVNTQGHVGNQDKSKTAKLFQSQPPEERARSDLDVVNDVQMEVGVNSSDQKEEVRPHGGISEDSFDQEGQVSPRHEVYNIQSEAPTGRIEENIQGDVMVVDLEEQVFMDNIEVEFIGVERRARDIEEGISMFAKYVKGELVRQLEPALQQLVIQNVTITDKVAYQDARVAIEKKLIEYVCDKFPNPNRIPPSEGHFKQLVSQLKVFYPALYGGGDPAFIKEIRVAEMGSLAHALKMKFGRLAVKKGLRSKPSPNQRNGNSLGVKRALAHGVCQDKFNSPKGSPADLAKLRNARGGELLALAGPVQHIFRFEIC